MDGPKTDAPQTSDVEISDIESIDRKLVLMPDGLNPPLDAAADQQPWPDQQLSPDQKPTVDMLSPPGDGPSPADLASPIPDTAPPMPPCSSGKSPVFSYQSDMVICSSKTKYDQCGAAQICNQSGGWHLCTASEFIGRGGASTPVTSGNRDAWLASCLRDNGKPSKPTNAVCSSCAEVSATMVGVACDCATCSPVFGMDTANVGVTPWDACMFLAFIVNKSAGYWAYEDASALYTKAVCCN